MTDTVETSQHLIALLPAIYREDAFLGRYLAHFERLLLGIEREVDTLSELFDPMTAREEFLPWLSSWVGFALRADLTTAQQRAFLARIVSLYQRRGTSQNLQELLAIFTIGAPVITEPPATSGLTHYFHVTVILPVAVPDVLQRQGAIARALIELEKPAHTHYDLELQHSTMQIGHTSTLGVDTLLGTRLDGT